jgi:hypothetical protein
LLIGQVACAVRPSSGPKAYNGNLHSGTEQKMANSDPRPPAAEQSEAIWGEKAARTTAQQKISSRLLYAVKIYGGELENGEGPMRRSSVEVDEDGATIVDIKAEVTEEVLARIEALGGTVMSSFPQYQAIRARIPLDQIEAVAEMPQIIFIRPADEPMMN